MAQNHSQTYLNILIQAYYMQVFSNNSIPLFVSGFSLSSWRDLNGIDAVSALTGVDLARLIDTLDIGKYLYSDMCDGFQFPYSRTGWINCKYISSFS